MSTETVWNRRLACAGARRSSSAMWREIKVAEVKRAELDAPSQCVTTQALFSISTYELQ